MPARGGFDEDVNTDQRLDDTGKTDARIMARMDELATGVVADLNKDGVVDYEDVLVWSRLFVPAESAPGIPALGLLSLAILEGSPQEDLLSTSRLVLGIN